MSDDREHTFWSLLEHREPLIYHVIQNGNMSLTDVVSSDLYDLLDLRMMGVARVGKLLLTLEECGYQPGWRGQYLGKHYVSYQRQKQQYAIVTDELEDFYNSNNTAIGS